MENEAELQEWRAFRIAAIVEMFDGIPRSVDESILRRYCHLTRMVPDHLFRKAIEVAEVDNASGFPVTPGQIVAAAKKISIRDRDETAGLREPEWYSSYLNERKERPDDRRRYRYGNELGSGVRSPGGLKKLVDTGALDLPGMEKIGQ